MQQEQKQIGWRRRYAVGNTIVRVSFCKREASDQEVLDVLGSVERMVRKRKS